jgi:predicted outer membrane repeat protein
VSLTNFTVSGNSARNGGGDGGGGGIFSYGDVNLTNSTVSGNSALNGGGIQSHGDVSLTDSTVSGNSAFTGGGILSRGDVSLTNSTVSGNSAIFGGGGIYNNGDLNLTNSTVSGNYARGFGGGIFSHIEGNVSLTNSTVPGNSAGYGGGIWVRDSSLTVIDHPGSLDLDLYANNAAVSLSAFGPITLTGSVQTRGKPLTLNATQAIDTTALTLDTSGAIGGGNITITAAGEIKTRSLNTPSLGTGNGGNVSLTSTNGTINTLSGTGVINTTTPTGDAGTVILQAPNGIAVGLINAEAQAGAGGAVTLDSVNGFVNIQSALAAADSSFNSFDASIASAGAISGGPILIRHGGNGETPFSVGDVTTNGTSAALTAGTGFTILPTQAYLTSHTQSGISILTNIAPPVTPSQNPVTPSQNPVTPSQNLEIPPEIIHAVSGSDVKNQFLDNEEFIRRIGRQLGGETLFNAQGGFTWSLPGEQVLGGSLDENVILQEFIRLDTFITNQFSVSVLDGASAIDFGDEPISEDDITQEEDNEESIVNIRETFKRITEQTGTVPALVYALSQPDAVELILITPDNQLFRIVIPEADSTTLRSTIRDFRSHITNVRRPNAYVKSAQQLYDWLIRPLETRLDALDIDTLIFAMGEGLRTLPLAALHDGEQFLVEKYSIGQIPSLSLTNSEYQPLHDAQTLVMGASEFKVLDPLPAVPSEAEAIASLLNGEVHLNEAFTRDNLKKQSRDRAFDIVHLATHAEFQGSGDQASYIQLWGDEKLPPHELRELRWYDDPQVELLVLSACKTAVGDREAELGFAGLAVQAGVKSAMASLWYVSDAGTLALMSGFYQGLSDPAITIKAEALRQAQLALLRGDSAANFSHPYYWSSFMLVGSPW